MVAPKNPVAVVVGVLLAAAAAAGRPPPKPNPPPKTGAPKVGVEKLKPPLGNGTVGVCCGWGGGADRVRR
jgi:hypothetical protein